jgi:hypothetical protein
VPPVVYRRRQRHADLADDLAPHMEGSDGRCPIPIGERLPGHRCTSNARVCAKPY